MEITPQMMVGRTEGEAVDILDKAGYSASVVDPSTDRAGSQEKAEPGKKVYLHVTKHLVRKVETI